MSEPHKSAAASGGGRRRSRSRSRSRSLERPARHDAAPSAATAAAAAAAAPARRDSGSRRGSASSNSNRRRRQASTAAETAIAANARGGEAEEEEDADDSDWGASGDDEDLPEPIDLDAPDGAAQLFTALMSSVAGGASIEGMDHAQMHAILQALQEQGLMGRDEQGNIVLMGDGSEDEEDDGDENAAALREARAAARARLAGDDDDEEEDDEGEDEDDEEEEEEEDDDLAQAYYRRTAAGDEHKAESPSPPEMDAEALGAFATYAHLGRYPRNLLSSFARFQRDYHASGAASSAAHHRAHVASQFIPSACTAQDEFAGRAFCGKFSSPLSTGGPARFASATQDGLIHLYEGDSWKLYRQIEARDVGWSIVDVDFSRDSRFVIYSSWSHSVHLINAEGQFELHESLDFAPGPQSHCAMFGIRFSPNESREILAGLNNGIVILYDVERKRKVWSARGHDDDINSVCWLDDSGNLFATGSDDASIRIWDRRVLEQSADGGGEGESYGGGASPTSPLSRHATPVGGFLGHLHGLTCVAALPDGAARYMLSNSKDQSMKLWDLRNMNSAAQVAAGAEQRASQRRVLDYRWQRLSRRDVQAQAQAQQGGGARELDRSVVTLTGHTVAQTLIRCDFSPQHSTGFRYAVTGSADGSVFVYDILSGEIVKRIGGHHSIVRDVAWSDGVIVSASWDHTIRRHALHKEKLHDNSAMHQSGAAGLRRRMRARQEEGDEEEE